MKEEKRSIVTWAKDHKKELLFAGISIGTLIAMIGIKNRESLLEIRDALTMPVKKEPIPINSLSDVALNSQTMSFEPMGMVQKIEASEVLKAKRNSPIMHIRNLHCGWNASAEKRLEAEMLGITLSQGQTLVTGASNGNRVA